MQLFLCLNNYSFFATPVLHSKLILQLTGGGGQVASPTTCQKACPLEVHHVYSLVLAIRLIGDTYNYIVPSVKTGAPLPVTPNLFFRKIEFTQLCTTMSVTRTRSGWVGS